MQGWKTSFSFAVIKPAYTVPTFIYEDIPHSLSIHCSVSGMLCMYPPSYTTFSSGLLHLFLVCKKIGGSCVGVAMLADCSLLASPPIDFLVNVPLTHEEMNDGWAPLLSFSRSTSKQEKIVQLSSPDTQSKRCWLQFVCLEIPFRYHSPCILCLSMAKLNNRFLPSVRPLL